MFAYCVAYVVGFKELKFVIFLGSETFSETAALKCNEIYDYINS